MLTAAPVDRYDDLARCLVDVRNDIDDERSHQSLTRGRAHQRRVPRSLEILRKSEQLGCGNDRSR